MKKKKYIRGRSRCGAVKVRKRVYRAESLSSGCREDGLRALVPPPRASASAAALFGLAQSLAVPATEHIQPHAHFFHKNFCKGCCYKHGALQGLFRYGRRRATRRPNRD